MFEDCRNGVRAIMHIQDNQCIFLVQHARQSVHICSATQRCTHHSSQSQVSRSLNPNSDDQRQGVCCKQSIINQIFIDTIGVRQTNQQRAIYNSPDRLSKNHIEFQWTHRSGCEFAVHQIVQY